LPDYGRRSEKSVERHKVFALIYGTGGIVRGESELDPLFGEITMGSDTVVEAFHQAIENKEVKAIIFRVDSPGGSYIASDTIWHEVARARGEGKPVVVSMGNVAGSGGYYVAMGADRIFAQPGTITGSIGVVGGKMVVTELWEKIGISWDAVHTSPNATTWSPNHNYTDKQWSHLQAELDRIYSDFLSKASRGREMSMEEIRAVAQGKIWTGAEAQKAGLVDELGGVSEAIKRAKKLIGIQGEVDIKLKVFPQRKSFLQRILGDGPDNIRAPVFGSTAEALVGSCLKRFAPITGYARSAGFYPRHGVLTMQELYSGN
jgi:protease-4